MKVGIIGVGNMGGVMAKRFLEDGFDLVIYDLNKEAVEKIVEAGGKAAKSPKEVAQLSDFVITSLPNDMAVESVYLEEDGLIAGARKGQTFIEMSTITPKTSRKIAEIAEQKGIDWLDAPVFGGPHQCGEWTLPVGGKKEVLEKSRKVLEQVAENLFLIGGPGCGHAAKLCNNILTGVNAAAIAEVLTLATKLGVPPRKIQEAIINSPSAGSSNALKYYDAALKRDFKPIFVIDLLYKDLDLATKLARECKMPLPSANTALQIFEIARAKGMGRENWNSILKLYEEWAGEIVKG